ncbi:MAG: hypothetical protein C5B60_05895 [Chloroflexi bacterium]|nr:MAG: hypothetical protein C5B60_05895 [Chloroflexota bacterium]
MGQFTGLAIVFAIVFAILLVIPATILLGHRRPYGGIVLSSGATLVIFALFWLLGGPSALYSRNYNAGGVFILFLLLGGVVQLVACWALSLNAAAQARRWLWDALLIVGGLLTFGTILLLFLTPLEQCVYAQQFSPFGPDCPPINPLVPILIFAGYFVGPAAALVYGVRPSLLDIRSLRGRTPQLPEDLTVSRLSTPDEPTVEPDLPL